MGDVRLIDANALKKEFENEWHLTEYIDYMVDQAPAIDAVPVVRCFECANRGDKRKCPMCFDESDGIDFYQVDNTDDDGFCHMGAKMDENKKED